jgi:hypothetical protein
LSQIRSITDEQRAILIHETAECPKNFTEVKIIALKEKPIATKCSDHGTISTITYTAKILVKTLRRSTETKV